MILKFIVSTRVQLTNEYLHRGIGRMTNKIRRNSSPKKSSESRISSLPLFDFFFYILLLFSPIATTVSHCCEPSKIMLCPPLTFSVLSLFHQWYQLAV